MYEKHFGLRQRPFRPTPDSDCYYPATTHEQALDRLLQAVADDEGLVLLTGAPGMGKTLLCHRFLERLGSEPVTAFLTNSHVGDRAGLLQALLFELSLPHQGRGEQEMRLALTECLLQNFQSGRRTLLLIDEAQHLGVDHLEELRLLGNLEARQGKAVQVLLIAQPSLRETLRLPQLAAFQQRLAIRANLEPLDVHEAPDYIVHQLRAVGGRADRIIADEALEVLARGTHGIPRLLNQATHQALTLACAAGAGTVDVEAAVDALALLELNGEAAAESSGMVLSGLHEPNEDLDPETEADNAIRPIKPETEDDPGLTLRRVASPRRPA